MASIADIEGIGPVYAEKLSDAGIKTTEKLLKEGCAKAGRKALASTTGLDEKKILRWVNMADLFRLKGVGEEYSDLLEAAGVDTVKELRNRNAANLHAKMTEVNEEKSLVRSLPSADKVADWVEQAKGMGVNAAKMGTDVGLNLDFDKSVVANSFNAHRLIHFAKENGLQLEMKERLFKAFFTEGKNIDDMGTLTALAVNLSFKSGITFVTTLPAPVDVITMLIAAERPLLGFLWKLSNKF